MLRSRTVFALLSSVALLCILCTPVHAKYTTVTSTPSAEGWVADLQFEAPGSPYGNDVTALTLNVYYETDERVRFRLTPTAASSDVTAFQLPDSLLVGETPTNKATANKLYQVFVSDAGQPFSLNIRRADSGNTVWSTDANFVFSSQYLQIDNQLGPEPIIYGLGERDASLRMSFNSPYVIFSQDVAPINSTLNQYGAHPFYMQLDSSNGQTNGVLLWNAHSMEINLSHLGTLNYKIVGGVLDFFVFLGPTPATVVQQYTELVGKPYLPPLWSLGFHQCRWGYRTANDTRAVVENYIANGLPLDTIWNDIDYMHHYNDFTLDPYRYSPSDTQSLDDWLVATNRHHVYIVDPAIPVRDYDVYHRGLEQNVFAMRNNQSAPVWSKVWPPQPVLFPDFSAPATPAWWQDNIQEWFAMGVRADGLWIDMNEPSAFCNGEYPHGCRVVTGPPYSENTTDCPLPDQQEMVRWGEFVLQERARTDNLPASPAIPLSPPPFIPGKIAWNVQSLDDNTLAMSARQNWTLHYNIHSLYGYMESIATHNALRNLSGRRPFVLSRSTFVGSGRYTAHWTGDNQATFESMALSIPHILSFSLFGIPMVGSDICGFNSNTTEELCARWMQLGAWYPFSRNHNTWNTIAQEPYALGNDVLAASKTSLLLRYQLLPYLYALFADATMNGATVARPVFFEYPSDANTFELERTTGQYLLGSSLLISPVLQPGVTEVEAYLPNDDWFLLSNGERLAAFDPSTQPVPSGTWVTLPAPINSVLPLIVRGGGVLAMADTVKLTTAETMDQSNFKLLVALATPRSSKKPAADLDAGSDHGNSVAQGKIYMDQGDSLDPIENNAFGLWSVAVDQMLAGLWTMKIARTMGLRTISKSISGLTVYGLSEGDAVQAVWLNGDRTQEVAFTYDNTTLTLHVSQLNLPLPSPTDAPLQISWTTIPPATPTPSQKPTNGPNRPSDGFFTPTATVLVAAGGAGALAMLLAMYCYCCRSSDGYSQIQAQLAMSDSATGASNSASAPMLGNDLSPETFAQQQYYDPVSQV